MLQAYIRAHVNNILATLPDFVGESYDEDAWRDCANMVVRRITEHID